MFTLILWLSYEYEPMKIDKYVLISSDSLIFSGYELIFPELMKLKVLTLLLSKQHKSSFMDIGVL